MEQHGLTTIFLGGALGQKFGKVWQLYVNSPGEAIKAIDVNTGGKLKDYLFKQKNDKFYKISIHQKGNTINREQINQRSGNRSIYVTPVARGKSSGWGKVFAAIAIIVIAIYAPELLGYTHTVAGVAGGAATTVGGFAAGSVGAIIQSGFIMAGISLLIGGIVQLLTPVPNYSNAAETTLGSSLFSGNSTSVAQGLAVALVYGRALVSPMPIAIAFGNYDQSISGGGTTTDDHPYDVGPDGRVIYYAN